MTKIEPIRSMVHYTNVKSRPIKRLFCIMRSHAPWASSGLWIRWRASVGLWSRWRLQKKADCSQPQIHPQSGDKSSALIGWNFMISIRNGLIVYYCDSTGCFIASDTDVFPYFSITSNNRTLKIWFYALWNMLITQEAGYFPMDHIRLILRSLKKWSFSLVYQQWFRS